MSTNPFLPVADDLNLSILPNLPLSTPVPRKPLVSSRKKIANSRKPLTASAITVVRAAPNEEVETRCAAALKKWVKERG
jgi:hypothetical protein